MLNCSEDWLQTVRITNQMSMNLSRNMQCDVVFSVKCPVYIVDT